MVEEPRLRQGYPLKLACLVLNRVLILLYIGRVQSQCSANVGIGVELPRVRVFPTVAQQCTVCCFCFFQIGNCEAGVHKHSDGGQRATAAESSVI